VPDVPSSLANVLEQKCLHKKIVKLPQHWFGTNMTAVLLLWDVTTSYENSLWLNICTVNTYDINREAKNKRLLRSFELVYITEYYIHTTFIYAR